MSSRFEYLFRPIGLGPIEIPNRICFSAHSTHLAVDGLPSQRQIDYYAERARGGAGWIVIGGSVAHESSLWDAQGFNLVSDERAVPGYQALTEVVHRYGAKITTQLDHYGVGVPATRPCPWPVYSPSNWPSAIDAEIPKAVDEDDMKMLLDATARGVEIAREGGFDGIEICASFDTSLLQNFLSPRFNKRTDGYGGSLENRLRFPIRMLEVVHAALDRKGCVGIKIVGDEMVDGGLNQDDVKEICVRLSEAGLVDYIHVCLGTRNNYELMIPEMSYPAGLGVYLAAGVREVVEVPVVAVKRIDDPILAERILADGQADIIAMTRALIADPDLPNKAREGSLETIRQCTASNQECGRRGSPHIKLPIRCVHNPAIGYEGRLGVGTLKLAERRKKVIVVGGGPAGMRAAKVAAQRGHEVHLYERREELGGQILAILKVSSRKGYESVLRYLRGEIERRGVHVHLGFEVTEKTIVRKQADAVIVTAGALPLKTGYSAALPAVDRMPGADQDHVLTVFDVFGEANRAGRRVVLVDEFGQYEGMVTAEYLATNGHEVTLVTRHAIPGGQVDFSSRHEYLTRFKDLEVKILVNMATTAIDGHTVKGRNELTGELWEQETDSVVLVMGKLPNEELYHQVRDQVGEIYRAGDCVAPRTITDAIYEGNLVGRQV